MDAVYIGLIVVGYLVVVGSIVVLLGRRLDRWADVHGVERGHGRAVPLPAGLPARYSGLAHFWHCRLPAVARDGNRILGAAVVAPPVTIILLAFGKWWGALAFGALAILAWWSVLRGPVDSVPTRGPCLRAE